MAAGRSRHARGLLDTSVVVDIDEIDVDRLPVESLISSLTLAELAAGPHAAKTGIERGNRQEQLQRIESGLDSLAFGTSAARAYGRVYAAVLATGRKPRGTRNVDLMIAATALANELPLYTRNAADLKGVEKLIDVIQI